MGIRKVQIRHTLTQVCDNLYYLMVKSALVGAASTDSKFARLSLFPRSQFVSEIEQIKCCARKNTVQIYNIFMIYNALWAKKLRKSWKYGKKCVTLHPKT